MQTWIHNISSFNSEQKKHIKSLGDKNIHSITLQRLIQLKTMTQIIELPETGEKYKNAQIYNF